MLLLLVPNLANGTHLTFALLIECSAAPLIECPTTPFRLVSFIIVYIVTADINGELNPPSHTLLSPSVNIFSPLSILSICILNSR